MASIDKNGDYYDSMLHVDTFGEPKSLPQIGDEYQAELPRFLGDSSSLSRSSRHDGIRGESKQSFLLGLPINLMWIGSEVGLSHNLRKKPLEDSENAPPALDKTRECSDVDSCLVPGGCGEQWSAAEMDCFLLGLYVFAKNFVVVRKFVGTKEMGALLSYYYGKFCSSPEHRRWSKLRRMRNKRGRFGRGMFSGPRLQELLFRLLPTVGECENALLEVSRSFENKEMSLADFVFSLKEMVGAHILLEALGIVRADQDLSLGPYKSSIDRFWEEIWPRLLAKGWHLEQHTSRRCIGQVFLMPGIKKFSTRKLVRGDHYFDSIIDVMRKVAREPFWLEPDPDPDPEQCGSTTLNMRSADGNVTELRTTLPDDTQEVNSDADGCREPRDQPSLDMLPSTSSLGGSLEQPEARCLIDLNLPPEPDSSDQPDDDKGLQETDMQVGTGGEQTDSNPNPRRYSTRERPPTRRVLDCFAHGYLTASRRLKRKEASSHEEHDASRGASIKAKSSSNKGK